MPRERTIWRPEAARVHSGVQFGTFCSPSPAPPGWLTGWMQTGVLASDPDGLPGLSEQKARGQSVSSSSCKPLLPCPRQLASPGIRSFSTYTNTYNGTEALGFIQSRLHTLSVPFESTCPHLLLPQKQDEVSVSSRPSFKPPGYQG